jgi:2,5-furandicarboxylate decarboxylase 1
VVRLDDGTDVDSLTAIALELERRRRAPVLVVDKPAGYGMPVVTNLFASWDRVAGVLGVARPDFNAAWLRAEANPVKPVTVDGGPVQDVVLRGADADARALPIPLHFASDGGRYVSAGILVANDPDTGVRNLSFQRMQLKGPNRFGVSLHSRGHIWDYLRRAEARGEPLEVAVVVGAHPAVLMAATCRLGIDVDEYDIAGGLLGEPLELVRAATIGVDVPAQAEIVIEGRILPGVREPEGPFGEFPGYSSHRSTENVFEVTAITHRRDPIFLDVVPGNSSDHLTLATLFREPHLFERLREVVPNLKALHLPKSGTTFHCYISMAKTAEGQARQAMLLLFGMEPNIKLVVACDQDIDVHDPEQVLWAIATRVQADSDTFVVPSVFCNELDPSARDGMSTRMGIDATTPSYWKADRCVLDPETRRRATRLVDRILAKQFANQ